MRKIALISCMLLLTACGSDVSPKQPLPVDLNNNTSTMDAGTVNNTSTTDMGPDTVPDATMSSQDAPTIIELGASPTLLFEGDNTLVSAIVTDPQGVEDIVAGRLLDGQTQTLIGNFRSIGGGSYEIEVSWSQLDGVRPITFGPAGTQRALTAEFIDNANERSTRSLTLSLSCEGESACEGRCGLESCGGECLNPFDDYETSPNCGGCGVTCGANEICSAGSCVEGGGVNGPCEFQEDCSVEGSFCADEQQAGVPGGVCALICENSSACPTGSVCAFFFAANLGEVTICGNLCNTSADCRTGWSCIEQETVEGFENLCLPDGF